jgi:hypothetical protein
MILWFALLALAPIVFGYLYYSSAVNDVDQLKSSIESLKTLADKTDRKQRQNRAAREKYKEADRLYIDKNVESLKFLEPEAKSLEELVNNKTFAGDEMVKRRLEFLTGSENKILMTEGTITTYPYFQEVISTLSKSVEVNLQDIKKVLSVIEGVEIPPYKIIPNRPQMIILDFKIDRKETEKNEVYILNMKLLKREYL